MFGTRAKSYALYSAGHSLNVPTAIPVPRRVASVCLGADHTLLVDVNGCLWAAACPQKAGHVSKTMTSNPIILVQCAIYNLSTVVQELRHISTWSRS